MGQGGDPRSPQPAAAPEGQAAPRVLWVSPKVTDNSFAQFKEHSAFNVLFSTWVVAVFAVVATMFFGG